MTETLEIVDLRTFPDEDLLEKVYRELYIPSFPVREEGEDPTIWRPALWGTREADSPKLHFLVAGNELGDPVARRLFGFVSCEYYPRSRCGLLAYLAVDPERRRQSLGRELAGRAVATLVEDAAAEGTELAAIFGEIHDPAKVSPGGDSIPPSDRVTIMARLGAKRVPITYVQPELAPGQGRSYALMLVAFPFTRDGLTRLPAATIEAFLRELYVSLNVARPDEDPDFMQMMSELEKDVVDLDPIR